MLFTNHSIPSCWQVFIAPHLETAPHDILYDSNPPPQPLSKTCVVLGVCQTPTRWVTYIRSPSKTPAHTRVLNQGLWWMFLFLLCENSIAYQVLHAPTLLLLCGCHTPRPLVVGGGVLLLSRDTRLNHFLFCFLFCFRSTRFVRYAQCVLWLESLILAQDERWRRA